MLTPTETQWRDAATRIVDAITPGAALTEREALAIAALRLADTLTTERRVAAGSPLRDRNYAAKLLGVSAPQVTNLVDAGELEAHVVGTRYKFTDAQLAGYLERSKARPRRHAFLPRAVTA